MKEYCMSRRLNYHPTQNIGRIVIDDHRSHFIASRIKLMSTDFHSADIQNEYYKREKKLNTYSINNTN